MSKWLARLFLCGGSFGVVCALAYAFYALRTFTPELQVGALMVSLVVMFGSLANIALGQIMLLLLELRGRA